MVTICTDALIVGGSLNGLSSAVFLASRGIRTLVVERNRETTVQYKFAGISPRTMEIFRGFGLEETIRAHRTGDQKSGEIASAKNLADPDVHFMGKPWADTADLSAATAETCDQERLEPLLRARAEEQGATTRYGVELVTFEERSDGVTATIRDLASDAEEQVEAAYLIAADGGSGKTRGALGIGRTGEGALQHWMNLIFDTDLKPYLQGRLFTSCFVTDINGSFTPRDDRWLLAVQYDEGTGEAPEDFDAERVRSLVRAGAGDTSVRADLFDARSWDVAALVADRFATKRCFLVGDAAHLMPPTGGFGGNTGIHDAHNLAWKLAAVIKHEADPILLDSYDRERQQIATRTLSQAMARLTSWFKNSGRAMPDPEPILDDYWVIFGQVYGSGAFVAEDTARTAGFENPREPSGRPGTRAPHLIVPTGDGPTPIHDLVAQGRFVLLAGSEGESWAASAPAGREEVIVPIILDRTTSAAFERSYQVGHSGAALIRPDGFIAWKVQEATEAALEDLASAWTSIGMR